MKVVNVISAILLLIGGLNWGLVGFFDFNLISYIFGMSNGGVLVSRILYALVGLSFLWELIIRYDHLSDFVCTEHHPRLAPITK